MFFFALPFANLPNLCVSACVYGFTKLCVWSVFWLASPNHQQQIIFETNVLENLINPNETHLNETDRLFTISVNDGSLSSPPPLFVCFSLCIFYFLPDTDTVWRKNVVDVYQVLRSWPRAHLSVSCGLNDKRSWDAFREYFYSTFLNLTVSNKKKIQKCSISHQCSCWWCGKIMNPPLLCVHVPHENSWLFFRNTPIE